MNSRTKNRLLLLIIMVVFSGPLIVSWWLVNYTNIVAVSGKSNHGKLISPPVLIDDLDLFDPVADQDYRLYGKWSIAYIAASCEEICVDNMYRMRQIHIAMDKYSLRVQRVLLLTGDQQQDLKKLFIDYAGQRIARISAGDVQTLLLDFKQDKNDDPATANRLYIIDPLGKLIVSYPPRINPRKIMKDLKKLLKISRIG